MPDHDDFACKNIKIFHKYLKLFMYQEANLCGIRNSSILFLKKIAQTTLKKQLLSVVNFLSTKNYPYFL